MVEKRQLGRAGPSGYYITAFVAYLYSSIFEALAHTHQIMLNTFKVQSRGYRRLNPTFLIRLFLFSSIKSLLKGNFSQYNSNNKS